jgi:hypothetical protein
LQQYANYANTNIGGTQWDGANPLRHEVMKAILINSADKIAGVHGSNRDVLNEYIGGQRWEQTLAALSDGISLDEQMGAGALNVGSALTNFQSGEYGPGSVPNVAWDLGVTGGIGTTREYILEEPIPANSWVAVTLAWDRRVELTSVDDEYDFGEDFFDRPVEQEVNNLDIYLLPSDSDDLPNATSASVSLVDNVEHIFFKVQNADQYKIVLRQEAYDEGGLGDEQDYALAWWAGEEI